MLAMTAGAGLLTASAQRSAASAQVSAINQQNDAAASQIAAQTGQQMTERARAARVERASARAAASDAGVNLGSGSFLAALQTSSMAQGMDQGVMLYNNKNQVAALNADATAALSRVTKPTLLGAGITIGTSMYGAYGRANAAQKAGIATAG